MWSSTETSCQEDTRRITFSLQHFLECYFGPGTFTDFLTWWRKQSQEDEHGYSFMCVSLCKNKISHALLEALCRLGSEKKKSDVVKIYLHILNPFG